MNIYGLGRIRTIPLDLEDGLGLSIFDLVSPDYGFLSNVTGKSVVGDIFFHSWHIFSLFLGTE
jgi:hypothetical protein